MIIDSIFESRYMRYVLIRVYHLDGHVVRVRIIHVASRSGCLAVVEVLTPGLTWTNLAEAPASTWLAQTPDSAHGPDITGQRRRPARRPRPHHPRRASRHRPLTRPAAG